MPVSISELGNSLRCPKDDCDRFGKIMRLDVKEKVEITLICEKHMKKYKNIYSINQFVRLAEAGLIEANWIEDFQKKFLVLTGQFIKIDGGMEGAFIVKDKKKIQDLGKKIMCKCGSIASVTFIKVKKAKSQINLYCSECMPKGKKIWMDSTDVLTLARAGLIDPSIGRKIKDIYEDDGEQFDVTESYSVGKGIMAGWVQEEIGMLEEDSRGKKCYICGTPVSDAMDRCPKCGSDL